MRDVGGGCDTQRVRVERVPHGHAGRRLHATGAAGRARVIAEVIAVENLPARQRNGVSTARGSGLDVGRLPDFAQAPVATEQVGKAVVAVHIGHDRDGAARAHRLDRPTCSRDFGGVLHAIAIGVDELPSADGSCFGRDAAGHFDVAGLRFVEETGRRPVGVDQLARERGAQAQVRAHALVAVDVVGVTVGTDDMDGIRGRPHSADRARVAIERVHVVIDATLGVVTVRDAEQVGVGGYPATARALVFERARIVGERGGLDEDAAFPKQHLSLR